MTCLFSTIITPFLPTMINMSSKIGSAYVLFIIITPYTTMSNAISSANIMLSAVIILSTPTTRTTLSMLITSTMPTSRIRSVYTLSTSFMPTTTSNTISSANIMLSMMITCYMPTTRIGRDNMLSTSFVPMTIPTLLAITILCSL